jgi:hypothetical protein
LSEDLAQLANDLDLDEYRNDRIIVPITSQAQQHQFPTIPYPALVLINATGGKPQFNACGHRFFDPVLSLG